MPYHFARAVTPEIIERTRQAFQPYSKEPLSDEDCRETYRNVMGVMHTLLEIRRDRDRRRAEAGDSVPEGYRVDREEGVQKS
jgi:hypothetical protein